MTQQLRTWEKTGIYETYRTEKHLSYLKFTSGKYDVEVLDLESKFPYTFGNSFDTKAEARTWVEQLS